MQWCLKVRVVGLWVIPDREKEDNPQSTEMVLQDVKGDRIHATIGRYVMRLFKGKISELGLCIMKNFVVGPNTFKFRTTKHMMRLTFTNRTMVEEINDLLFGINIFNIRPYKHLIDQVNVDENELFDIVGEIVGHGEIQPHKQNDKNSVFMNVELQDHELNNIEATFWGDFVEQMTPYLDGSNAAPVVVVMQFIREHKFQVELDTILDKNALFKVAVKSHNVEQHVETYTILKICDDEELTKQFRPSFSDDDFPDPDFNSKKVAAETHEITDSNPDNDLNTPTNTPAKRSLWEIESLGIEVEDDPNA
ncbi:hypothetical protein CQW23_08510 [Capsicum baccatum]|uniref:Replication protein A 70 kDa DNA-binding subunit B/D first OB fold domain-containing protein n=1 Tax=Capsicum baccatum TaxID=33114 RepID=A0A2G2X984_CAPBA|nr:hypothetical protein CQW23_08510 [Capsicum baccatum]